MSERKLATVRKIDGIRDIVFENKDTGQMETAQNIVCATIGGWSIVTQRSNNFKEGDLVVYFEIDSVLPKDNPEFAFMEKSNYRLKTIRLKGQVSQGLIMPLEILNGENEKYFHRIKDNELYVSESPQGIKTMWSFEISDGLDVTDILGVTKYEPEIAANLRGQIKGTFPGFLTKTDAERIQNCGWILSKYSDVLWRATEKLDGTSFTCFLRDGEFGVCSRNMELKETDDNKYWQTARTLDIEGRLKALGMDNIAVQGEIVGAGIQKNMYKLPNTELYVFDLFDINTSNYIDTDRARAVVEDMGLKFVPNIVLPQLPATMAEALAMAEGCSALNPDSIREGIVFKPITELRDDRFGRVMFKAISNQYLLKNGG